MNKFDEMMAFLAARVPWHMMMMMMMMMSDPDMMNSLGCHDVPKNATDIKYEGRGTSQRFSNHDKLEIVFPCSNALISNLNFYSEKWRVVPTKM